jgi:hypothetical protein
MKQPYDRQGMEGGVPSVEAGPHPVTDLTSLNCYAGVSQDAMSSVVVGHQGASAPRATMACVPLELLEDDRALVRLGHQAVLPIWHDAVKVSVTPEGACPALSCFVPLSHLP